MSLVIDLDEVHDLFTQTEPNTNHKTSDKLQRHCVRKKKKKKITRAKSFPNEGSQMN